MERFKVTVLCLVLVAAAGCTMAGLYVPLAGKVGGAATCAQLSHAEQETLREVILPQLLAADAQERRRLLEASNGLIATKAPEFYRYTAWGYQLPDAFGVGTEYDAAIDGVIQGCVTIVGPPTSRIVVDSRSGGVA